MKDFLRKHFQGVTDGSITLYMKRKGDKYSNTKWFNLQDADIWDKLEAAALDADENGWDCYFSTCPGTRADMTQHNRLTQKHVTSIPALFIDFDTKADTSKADDAKIPDNQESAAAALKALLQPSYMVNSGHGIHAYWKLDNPLSMGEPAQKLLRSFAAKIAEKTGFKDLDISASETARILRLPGTHNHKDTPLQVSIMEDTGIIYSVDSIMNWIKPKRITIPKGTIPEGKRNSTLFTVGRSLRGQGLNDESIRKTLTEVNSKQCIPPLDDTELNKTIASVCTKSPGPNGGKGYQGGTAGYVMREIGTDEPDSGKEMNLGAFLMGLEYDRFGKPVRSINNFLTIMKTDPFYTGVRFNELKGSAEKPTPQGYEEWRDADDAASIYYIESSFDGLYSKEKHELALQNLLSLPDRKVHPVKESIQAIKWDGVNRIESFLTRWMKADDTPYVREVSRLIFAGGINRLYEPGCKFDLIPILIGTNQGEGKSTIVRWLAMQDDFFGVINMFEGQASMEQLLGVWIGEVSEMLAMARAREVETVKDFISRQTDYWRKPYEKRPAVQKRSCIMIGTTNHSRFLSDKTGNRRFLPVRVNSTGSDIFDNENELKGFIRQCWAEAKARYDAGNMPPYEDRNIISDIREAQENALEDDWRVGAIQAYLEKKPIGTRVCIRELRQFALYPTDNNLKDDKKESRELGTLMDREPDWEKMAGKARPTKCGNEYGSQYCWEKIG